MTRRILLSNMRMQFSFEGPEKVHGSAFEGKQMSLLDDTSQMGATVQAGEKVPVILEAPEPQNDLTDTITELEDTFSRQVKSLAESIDDALNCRSLRRDEIQPEQKVGQEGLQQGDEHHKLDEICDVTLFIDEEELSPLVQPSRSIDQPSSSESEQRTQSVGSSQEHWSMEAKDDKVDTDTSYRSTPSLECQGHSQLCMDLPLLTIEPPSDSSADMSDRSEPQNIHERTAAEPQASPKQISHGLPPRVPSLSRDEEPLRHRQVESHLATNGNRQSKSESDFSDGDNDSMNSNSNSIDTINSESSSRDSLSKQTYHKDTRNSWDSPAFSSDLMRKRQYRIGLNLFNKYVFK